MRIINYDKKKFEDYKSNLKMIGSLSLLFSESDDPWLDYRVPENLYCGSFGAENFARSCLTADAKLKNIGIGIKTFTEGNKKTWQKIAEFNKARKSYIDLEPSKKTLKIAELRNERIRFTMATYGLEQMIYHCVVRNKNGFHFYEEEMQEIDVKNINIISSNDKSIIFTDNKHEYNFNLSKSVLYKRFEIDEYFDSVSVTVAENPYDVLKSGIKSIINITEKRVAIIPLYSVKNGVKLIFPKSGLNQWNAGGRKRDINEVYIPYNKNIQEKYEGFFPNKDTPFKVQLPNGKLMTMKLCQNGKKQPPKAIMSNPNSKLGEWILREVLQLDEDELLTYEKLLELGIDSIEFEKLDDMYKINFREMDN